MLSEVTHTVENTLVRKNWGEQYFSKMAVRKWAVSHCTLRESCLSRIRLFATLCTIVHQPPLSMEFSQQEYWVGGHALLMGIFPAQGSNLHL